MALGRTVKELLATIDPHELSEWQAFDEVRPFGDDAADIRCGMIASILANANRKKGSREFSPKDFILGFRGEQARKITDMDIFQRTVETLSARTKGRL